MRTVFAIFLVIMTYEFLFHNQYMQQIPSLTVDLMKAEIKKLYFESNEDRE